ncbi:MAG: Nudix family hydrolase [Gammaproteobacteria bacterium]|nr:Nudix family hydrolase [Gammaproteobacteria bacterium]
MHVAVAVVVNSEQKVLIAKRPDHVHQGGFWEFPGGKVEQDEAVYDALCREIREELQIRIQNAHPLIKITHHYKDKSVLLDVWLVTEFQGKEHGAEGQPLMWQSIHDLNPDTFPAANRKIIAALQLPDKLLITGDFSNLHDFNTRLVRSLQFGVKLIQLRCKAKCDTETYQAIVHLSKSLCESSKAKLLLNSDPELADELQLGLHVNSRDLFEYHHRPITRDRLLSVSCHNLTDLQQAETLQADFALLSPVQCTSSHPEKSGMGWQAFADLTSAINIPVFALGGMHASDINVARQAGGQGIAAISELWGGK